MKKDFTIELIKTSISKRYICFKLMLKKLILIICSLFFFNLAYGKSYFVTQTGAGLKDGTSWINAADEPKINTIISGLVASDILYIGSGNYTTAINITVSGLVNNQIVIEGFDNGGGYPVFTGKWVETAPASNSSSGILINDNSYLTIKNFSIKNFMYGVKTGTGLNLGLIIDNVDMYKIREGIYIENCQNSEIKNCSFIRYTKRGIRFNGNANFITVSDCFANATEEDLTWLTENYPFGFMIEAKAGNHDITYRRCKSINNYNAQTSADYWNGDGFTSEAIAYNVKFYDCISYGNTDAGWDDKSKNSYYENCVSIDNKRNFRIWNGRTVFKNCLSLYSKTRGGIGGDAGIWIDTGTVELTNCTFHNNKERTIYPDGGGKAIITNSILSYDSQFSYTIGNFTGSGNIVYAGSGTTHPGYVNDNSAWRGYPCDSYNSNNFPSKGYHCPGTPVNTEDILISKDISVFPSITNGIVNIKANDIISINVYSVNGLQYFVKVVVDNKINLSELPNGIYLIRIETQTKIISKKIIKI